MGNPKLLQEVTIDADNNTFAFELPPATSRTVNIDVGTYESMLEVGANLKSKLVAIEASFQVNFMIGHSSGTGITKINTTVTSWSEDWVNTDAALRQLLGYSGSETVSAYSLLSTKRHLKGWYSPVGVEYPAIRRRIARRFQDCDDGDGVALASSSVHKYVELLFDACYEGQLEPDAADVLDDGYGYTIDWTDRTFADFWIDVADKKFRFYPDAEDGSVSVPGTEGTDYWTCMRTDEELEFEQLDPDGYTWFAARLPIKSVGG